MAKRYNVPQYTKNLSKSTRNLSRSVLRTQMPTITDTVVNSADTMKEFRRVVTTGRNSFRMGNKLQSTIFKPVQQIIQNAKSDLKSGKIYNEERELENFSGMGDLMDEMIPDEVDNSFSSNNDAFNKVLMSTSASSMAFERSGDKISANATKNAEYLGQLQSNLNTQHMMIITKHHMETMRSLNNLQKIGMSLVDFNIKTTTDYFDKSLQTQNMQLNELREIKSMINEQLDLTKKIKVNQNAKKGIPRSVIESIFNSNGSINLKGFIDNAKRNMSNMIPVNKDLFKLGLDMFKDNPVGLILETLINNSIPKDIRRKLAKMDNSFAGVFTNLMGTINGWRNGKGDKTWKRTIGNIFGYDKDNISPNLGIYKNQQLDADLEIKKAKAITEVIPSYLSQILKSVSGIDKSFNYDTGKFMNNSDIRKKVVTDRFSVSESIGYRSSGSARNKVTAFTIDMDSKQRDILRQDMMAVHYWLMMTDKAPGKVTYSQALKEGLSPLINGKASYNMIIASYKSIPYSEIQRDRQDFAANMIFYNHEMTMNMTKSGMTSAINGLADDGNVLNIMMSKRNPNATVNRPAGSYGSKYDSMSVRAARNHIKNSNIVDDAKLESILEEEERRHKQETSIDSNGLFKGLNDKISRTKRKLGIYPKAVITKNGSKIVKGKNGKWVNESGKEFSDAIIKSGIDKGILIGIKTESGLHRDVNTRLDQVISIMDKMNEPDFFENIVDGVQAQGRGYFNKSKLRQGVYKVSSTATPTEKEAYRKAMIAAKRAKTRARDVKSKAGTVAQNATAQINQAAESITGKTKNNDSDSDSDDGPAGKEFTSVAKSMLPKTLLMGAAGGVISKLFKKSPFIGAIAGAGLNVMFQSTKVQSLLFGNPNNKDDHGLFGELRDKVSSAIIEPLKRVTEPFTQAITEKFIDPMKTWLTNKADNIADRVANYFGIKLDPKQDKEDKFKKDVLKKMDDINESTKSNTQQNAEEAKKVSDTLNDALNPESMNKKNKYSDMFTSVIDKLKTGGAKGLSAGKGALISSVLGMGPIPGAIFGAMFGGKKKRSSQQAKNDEKNAQDIDKEVEKSTKKKGKVKYDRMSVIGSSAISSMLGLGPIPGAMFASIVNNRRKKKASEEQQEQKYGEEIANATDDSKKKVKGGFFTKLKYESLGATASSLLGLGPIPGFLVGRMIAKNKIKNKQKEKEEQQDAQAVQDGIEKQKKPKMKGGIKGFFGRRKNEVLGMAASSLLGLGPIPGYLVARIYNKNKYKNKSDDIQQDNDQQNPTDMKTRSAPGGTEKKVKEASESIKERIEKQKRRREDYKKYKLAKDEQSLQKQLIRDSIDGDIQDIQDNIKNRMNSADTEEELKMIERSTTTAANIRMAAGSGGIGLGTEKKSSGLFDMIKKNWPLLLGALALNWMSKDGDLTVQKGAGAVGTALGLRFGKSLLTKIPGIGKIIKNKSGLGIGSAIGYGTRAVTNYATGEIAEGTADTFKTGAQIAKTAIGYTKIAKTAGTLIKSSNTMMKLSMKISNMLLNISKNNTIRKLIGEKLAKKLAEKSTSIATEVVQKALMKGATKAAAKAGTTGATTASKAIPIAGLVIVGIQAVWGFISGWNDVKNTLKCDAGYKPPVSLKMTSGIVKCIDDATLGLLDLFGVRDNVIEFIFKIFANEKEEQELEESKQKLKDDYNKFVEENPGTSLTFDKYNSLTNKTLWKKTIGIFKKGETLDDYKVGGSKYENTSVVNSLNQISGKAYTTQGQQYDEASQGITNYDSSTQNYIFMNGTQMGGSGGRGNSVVETISDVTKILANKNASNTKIVNLRSGRKVLENLGDKNPLLRKRNDTVDKLYKSMGMLTDASGARGGSSGKSPYYKKYMKLVRDANKKAESARGYDIIQPVKSGTVQSSGYGDKEGHKGVDILASRGTPVYAVADGMITYAGYGNVKWKRNVDTAFTVILKLNKPLEYNGNTFPRIYYTHMQENLCVVKGQSVSKGDVIGYTGIANEPHLHFSVMFTKGEGGHSNTMKIFGLQYNQKLPVVGNATERPTTGTGMTSVVLTDPGTGNARNASSITASDTATSNNLANSKKMRLLSTNANSHDIMKFTKDILSHGMYNGRNKIETVENDSIENIDISKNEKPKNPSTISKIVNKAKNIASNIWGGIKSGASKITNWAADKYGKFKKWISGSGARGTDSDYYSQLDPRWGNMSFGKYYGHRDTVADGGCGPTVAAMALQKLTGQKITPDNMAKLAMSSGMKYDDGGTDPNFFNAAGQKYGIGFDESYGIDSNVIASLKSGKPVVFMGRDQTGTSPFGPGSHYVLGTGLDSNGNINILDPQNAVNNRKFNINDVAMSSTNVMTPRGGRGFRYGRGSVQQDIVREALSRIGDTTFRAGDRSGSGKRSGSVNGMCLAWCAAVYNKVLYPDGKNGVKGYSNPHTIINSVGGLHEGFNGDIPIGALCLYDKGNIGDGVNGHAGIYIGNGQMVHAWGSTVTKSDVNEIAQKYNSKCGWWTGWLGNENTSETSYSGSTDTGEETSTTQSGGNAVSKWISKISGAFTKKYNDGSDLFSGNNKVDSILNNISNIWGGNSLSENDTKVTGNDTKVTGSEPLSSGNTINLPSGEGKASTYMNWKKITAKGTNQYKLRSESGQNYDSKGFGKIGDRYVVAMNSKFGNVGDYVDVKFANGQTLKCIIGDIKKNTDENSSEYGHRYGSQTSVVEFITNWTGDAYTNHKKIPNRGSDVVSVTNRGNYWGSGARGGYKFTTARGVSLASPNIPDRMKDNSSVMNNSGVNLVKSALQSKKSIVSTNNTPIVGDTTNDNVSQNISTSNIDTQAVISALNTIVQLLTSIDKSNTDISKKEPTNNTNVIPFGSQTSIPQGSYSSKQNLLSAIVSGI